MPYYMFYWDNGREDERFLARVEADSETVKKLLNEYTFSPFSYWGARLKVTTRKSYPFRSFYNSKKERLAFYVIEVVGEEPRVLIYSGFLKGVDCIDLKKSDLEEDQFRALELLESHMPKDLAEAIFKYARKDLGCRKGFSLKSFIRWKEAHQG